MTSTPNESKSAAEPVAADLDPGGNGDHGAERRRPLIARRSAPPIRLRRRGDPHGLDPDSHEVEVAMAAARELGVPTDPGRTVVIPIAMQAPSGPTELYRPSPTWQLLARFSLAHLIAALIAGAIIGSLVVVAVLRATPTYESKTTVELHQSGLFTSADAGPVLKLNGLRLRYALLAKTDAVIDPISEKVGLPADDVEHALTVTLNGASTLMLSIARTDDPVESQRLADAMGDQLAIYAANEQTDDKVAPDEQVQIRVVQRAQLGEKVAPEASRAVSSGLFAALAVAGGVYAGLQLIVGRARRRR